MTPIERAARALYERRPATRDHFTRSSLRPQVLPIAWEDLGCDERQPYLEEVEIVLTAIRAPGSDAMGAVLDKGIPVADALDIWQTVVDAMLAEGK